MKTILLIMVLASCVFDAKASCFSLYRNGDKVYQSTNAPFDVSTGSMDMANAEAQGMRLVISPDDTCDDYRPLIVAVPQGGQYAGPGVPPLIDPALLRQIRPMGAGPAMPYAIPPAPINPTFAERGEYRRMVRAMTGMPAPVRVEVTPDPLSESIRQFSDDYNTSRVIRAIERNRW